MGLLRSVPVMLDRPRQFRYTTNALVTMEQLTGLKMMAINMNAASFTEFRALLFAGLYDDDPAMTLEKAGNLIDEYGLSFVDKMAEALQSAMSGGEGNAERPAAGP